MPGILHISIFTVLTLLCLQANGYTYFENLNTENGFCEGYYGRIAVDDSAYDDENCEQIMCYNGGREVFGCGRVIPPDDERCELVTLEGSYPDCCPSVRCS